jgi:drug/metabolite transporter (DMT)-like permease
MKLTVNSKAFLLAAIAILCWSTMGTAFNLTLRFLETPVLLGIASVTALLILLIILLFQKKELFPSSGKSWLNSAIMGFFNPFMYYLILFNAYKILPAQEAMTLNYLWPVMLVIFMAVFTKTKIKLMSYLALLVSFLGVAIIATRGNLLSMQFSNLKGDLLALGSSLFWAGFFILNMKDKREAVQKMFLNFFFATIYIIVYLIFMQNRIELNFRGILGGIYIGTFEMAVSFVLWLNALKLSSHPERISNLAFLSPFLSLMIIALVLKEKILISTFTGLIFIVAGILIQQYFPAFTVTKGNGLKNKA